MLETPGLKWKTALYQQYSIYDKSDLALYKFALKHDLNNFLLNFLCSGLNMLSSGFPLIFFFLDLICCFEL